VSEELVLVPEVEARRALAGRRIRLQVLVPFGSWIGCGTLRVLRSTFRQAETGEPEVELVVGYEAYAA
jgi:hypothetical protein